MEQRITSSEDILANDSTLFTLFTPTESRTRRYGAGLLTILALALLLVTVLGYFRSEAAITLEDIRAQQQFLFRSVVLLSLAFIQPTLAIVLLALLGAYYALLTGLLSAIYPTALFTAAVFAGSWGIARQITRRLFAEQDRRDTGFTLALTNMVFIATLAMLSLITLSLHLHSREVLTVFASVWCGIGLLAGYSARSLTTVYFAQRPKESNSFEQFLNACLFGVLCLSAILLLYPGSLAGDADKAYLAFPKFFSIENTLHLSRDAFMRNVMIAYHHTQELVITPGHAFGGVLGLEWMCLLLVAIKLHAVYFVATTVGGFSRVRAKLVAVCFALLPIVVELNAVTRPENLLTICAMYGIYFLEVARRSRLECEASPYAQRSSVALNNLLTAALIACVAISVKLTGLYYCAAIGLTYIREWFAAAKKIRTLSIPQWACVAVAVLIASLWFVRNIIRVGTWGNMSPFAKYHLTIWFPPIRSLDAAWDFLTNGMLLTAKHTEFPDFAYGIYGLVLFPGLLIALAATGFARRMAVVSAVYFVCLLASTTQIRYVAPVVPLMMLALFARGVFTAGVLRMPKGIVARLQPYAPAFGFILIAAFLSTAYWVNSKSSITTAFHSRLALAEVDFSRMPEPFGTINEYVQYPDTVAATYLDYNTSMNAVLYRADPIESLQSLIDAYAANSFSHWMLFEYDLSLAYNLFFNDPHFFESIADPLIRASSANPEWALYLYRHNPALFGRLIKYVEDKGWDPKQTIIVSQDLLARMPYDFRVSEQIALPGLAHPLYRVGARWRADQNLFERLDESLPAPYAFYMEDIQLHYPQEESARLRLTRVPSFGTTIPEGTTRIVYTVEIPVVAEATDPHLEFYLHGTQQDQSIGASRLRVTTEGRELFSSTFGFRPKDTWVRVGQIATMGISKVEVAVELSQPVGSSGLEFKDIRLVLAERNTNTLPEQTVVKESRPYPGLFTAGAPLDEGIRPLWVFEDFTQRVMRNTAGYRSFRTNVETSLRNGKKLMSVGSEGTAGSKRYRLTLPLSLSSNVIVKVFIGEMFLEEGDSYTVRVIDPNAEKLSIKSAPKNGVYFEQTFTTSLTTGSGLHPVVEAFIPFVASPVPFIEGANPAPKMVDVEIEMHNKGTARMALDRVMIIVGRAKS